MCVCVILVSNIVSRFGDCVACLNREKSFSLLLLRTRVCVFVCASGFVYCCHYIEAFLFLWFENNL